MQNELQELNELEMAQISGGNPLLIVFAVYTFAAPIFAAGVAIGVADAVEGQS